MSKPSFLVVPASVLDDADPFVASLVAMSYAQGRANITRATHAVLEVVRVQRIVPLPGDAIDAPEGSARG